jgi:hypothetical protein
MPSRHYSESELEPLAPEVQRLLRAVAIAAGIGVSTLLLSGAIRAWLDSRSDRWVENFLNAPDAGEPLIVIRACVRPPGTTETHVYLDENWVGVHPGKRFQRAICHEEWREMAAIISGTTR